MRFFISSAQKRHQSSGTNCWRRSGSDHYYLFWGCLKLLSYWSDIHGCLEYILQTTVLFDISSLNFGAIVLDTQSLADKYLIKILLIGGRDAVTRRWPQSNAPTMEDWQGVIHEIYITEMLTFTLKLQSKK